MKDLFKPKNPLTSIDQELIALNLERIAIEHRIAMLQEQKAYLATIHSQTETVTA